MMGTDGRSMLTEVEAGGHTPGSVRSALRLLSFYNNPRRHILVPQPERGRERLPETKWLDAKASELPLGPPDPPGAGSLTIAA